MARLDHGEGRQRRHGQRFVDQVEDVEPLWIVDDQSGDLGEQVGATGEGGARPQVDAADGFGHPCRRLVLGDVAGLVARRDDGNDARLRQRRHVVGREHPALLEGVFADLEAVGEDGADGLVEGRPTEDHGAPSRRSSRVSSPRMATAISAGVTAPMSRPTGPWMRSSAVSSKPAALRRSSRAAWVRRLPREPM